MTTTSFGFGPIETVFSILLALFIVGVVITVLVLGFGLIFRLIGRIFVCIAGIIGDVFSLAANLLVLPFQLARALVLLVACDDDRDADAAATRFHGNVLEVCRRFWSATVQRPLRIVGIEVPPRRVPRSPNGLVAVAIVAGASQPPPPAPRGGSPSAAPPPWPDPSSVLGGFPGYTVESRLPSGGSGAKLYVAVPDSGKRAALKGAPASVVIKSFAIGEGSTLPQIVRESRSLEAARSLGLVLDHSFEAHRFWYAMPHFEGPSLGQLATSRHRGIAATAPLSAPSQRELVALVADVVASLARFHAAGLWHKDIKPDNIIVSNGHAQLIDVGLVTPLASTFTLTTHGTEYFRDPEMVRQALRGAKVNEVDGARFDLYSAGAVLYAVIENTFPAHGALSSFAKPSPDALRWIVRRSMAEYSKRYPSAKAMLEDLQFVLAAKDFAAVRPASLPSMRDAGTLNDALTGEDAGAVAPAATLAELARQTAREATVVARMAATEAIAAARAATARLPEWSARSKSGKKRGGSKSKRASGQAWSPWATAAIVLGAIMLFGTKFERSKAGEVRVSGPGFEVGSSESKRNRRTSASARKPAVDPITAELPSGDGKLLVDRAAILGGPLPEALEAQAIAGIGSKGWSPVIGDLDALAAVEALRGSTPETVQAELQRRGYSGFVRLETNGRQVIVKPVLLPGR